MPELFGRVARLNVGGLQVRAGAGDSGLDIGFRIEKTTDPEPNDATIEIVGLNREHRHQLGAQERVPVQLEAGYAEAMGLLFLGDLRRARSEKTPAWVTTLEAGDGEAAKKTGRVAQSFGAKTSLATVVRAAAKAMGVGAGNLESAAVKARWVDGAGDFRKGTVLSGNPADELTRILAGVGLQWSVLDGELQILEHGKPLDVNAVHLTYSTGLVGSPSVETRDGGKKYVKAKSLLNPALRPGALVVLASPSLQAQFRVDRVIYTGATNGVPWYADVEGRLQ